MEFVFPKMKIYAFDRQTKKELNTRFQQTERVLKYKTTLDKSYNLTYNMNS